GRRDGDDLKAGPVLANEMEVCYPVPGPAGGDQSAGVRRNAAPAMRMRPAIVHATRPQSQRLGAPPTEPTPKRTRLNKMSDIAERVKKIVVDHLGVEAEKVTENASFIDDLGADSLDTVELVMA